MMIMMVAMVDMVIMIMVLQKKMTNKHTNTMTFELTITYFMDYYLVKKGTILPLPSFGQCSKENIFHEDRGVPQERKN